MPDWELLVSVPHRDGVAAVVRDRADGSRWLTGDADAGGGTGLDDDELRYEGLVDGWATGALLPSGAVRAVVRDESGSWTEAAAGHGAWVAVTRWRPVAVRYQDAGGDLVRRPAPQAAAHRPAPEATTPCLACGAIAWQAVETARGSDAICARCGHRIGLGVPLTAVSADAVPDPVRSRHDEPVGADRAVFARAAFPVYGVAGWRGVRRWAGHGTTWSDGDTGDRVDEVVLGHGPIGGPAVEVGTAHQEYVDTDARRLHALLTPLAADALMPAAWNEASPFATALQLEHVWAGAAERAAAAEPYDRTIRVDDEPKRFLAATLDDAWVALTTLGEQDGLMLTVEISARGLPPEPLALERVRDVEPYLG